jgi:hypothetical protein
MNKESNINKQVAETMDVLNRIGKVDENPFLFEKTLNRMQQRKEPVMGRSMVLKRSFAVVMMLLVVNVFSFIYLAKRINEGTSKPDAAKELINEYKLDESLNNY